MLIKLLLTSPNKHQGRRRPSKSPCVRNEASQRYWFPVPCRVYYSQHISWESISSGWQHCARWDQMLSGTEALCRIRPTLVGTISHFSLYVSLSISFPERSRRGPTKASFLLDLRPTLSFSLFLLIGESLCSWQPMWMNEGNQRGLSPFSTAKDGRSDDVFCSLLF